MRIFCDQEARTRADLESSLPLVEAPDNDAEDLGLICSDAALVAFSRLVKTQFAQDPPRIGVPREWIPDLAADVPSPGTVLLVASPPSIIEMWNAKAYQRALDT